MKLEWKYYLRVLGSLFVLYLCIHYWTAFTDLCALFLSAASPLIFGCVIAYLVNILMGFYERHYYAHIGKGIGKRFGRPLCITAAFLTLFGIVALILWLVVPQLISCVQLIVAELPGAISFLVKQLEYIDFLSEDLIASLEAIDWQTQLEKMLSVLKSGFADVMGAMYRTLTSLLGGIVTAFVALIFSIYLLIGKDTLKRQSTHFLEHYLPARYYEKGRYVLTVMNDCFHRYIVGQCTEAVILGTLCTVGMLLLKLPYATMIGALVSFTALIPVAGAYIGAIVGAFMILTVDPMKAVIFLIFLTILQQVEGNLIYPKVVGASMGLPGIWVLAAVTIGGGMMGIGGMLLGVPLAATLYRLIRDDMQKDACKPQAIKTPLPSKDSQIP